MASFLSLTLIPLLLLTHSSSASTTSFVEKTCNTTKHPKICLTTFTSDPRSANATNATELSRLGIQLAAAKSNETLSYVSKLVNKSADYAEWAKLVLCKDVYNTSTYGVVLDGLRLFDQRNFTGAHDSVGTVNSAAVQCNNMGVAKLNKTNDFMFGFSDVVMMIIHSLY